MEVSAERASNSNNKNPKDFIIFVAEGTYGK